MILAPAPAHAWRSRITAALASIPLGLVVSLAVGPYVGQDFTGGTSTSGPTAYSASHGRLAAASGHIASSAAALPCDETDAMTARTAVVRRDGSLTTSRVRADKAWALAEQGETYVLGWCKA